MRKKWTLIDILVLFLEVIAPTVSILITCVVPNGQELSENEKLAIMSAGISIPVILLQISVTVGQNSNEKSIKENKESILEISEKLNHISPILENVFISDNERVKRFVYRRMDEVTKIIQSALNNNNSGDLRPSEYYEELLYLADLIVHDKEEQKKRFTGEIWAMTSFAEDEWIADEGYEKLWTEKLKDISEKGIKTRRLCIIPNDVYQIISRNRFSENQANSNNAFLAFIELLKMYYGNQSKRKTSEHYFLKENDNPDLASIKGFFAIKLSSGELHILHGETVNENGTITAKVLFDSSEIQRVRQLFELYAVENYKMENVIPRIAKQNGFTDYLNKNNIKFL